MKNLKLKKREIRKAMRGLGLPSSSINGHETTVHIWKPKDWSLTALVKRVRKALVDSGIEFRNVIGGRNTTIGVLVAVIS